VIDLLTAPFVEFAFMRRALAGCVALSVGHEGELDEGRGQEVDHAACPWLWRP
jgi:hypothetical protein